MAVEHKDWFKDEMAKATPIARRWVYEHTKKGEQISDIEEEFLSIVSAEEGLYKKIKETLCHYIEIHGLGMEATKYYTEFKEVEHYNRNKYNQILKKVHLAFAKHSENKDLLYLISKISEYLWKVSELGKTIYDMLKKGKKPDLDVWMDKASLQDAVFEENKQFLKQTLNHLQTLRKNRCKLGVNEIRLLLYHKEGCRREKLYRQTEAEIVMIYNNLPNEEQRRLVYVDICNFIAEIVPIVGYISPITIAFVMDRDFLSKESRDLLLKIKPVVIKLCMTPVVLAPLQTLYSKVAEKITKGRELKDSDNYVMEIMQAYNPEGIDPKVEKKWKSRLEDKAQKDASSEQPQS